jgi:hypothetical protein
MFFLYSLPFPSPTNGRYAAGEKREREPDKDEEIISYILRSMCER